MQNLKYRPYQAVLTLILVMVLAVACAGEPGPAGPGQPDRKERVGLLGLQVRLEPRAQASPPPCRPMPRRSRQ